MPRREQVRRDRIQAMKMYIVILIGFAAGILSGLLGVGGGTVMVPLMVYLLGMSQHRAHGTSLAAISAIAIFSAISYGSHGQVDWLIAIELAVGAVFGAAFGARIANALSARRLRRYFGLMMIVFALLMFNNAYHAYLEYTGAIASHTAISTVAGNFSLGRGLLTLAVGVFAGTLSGLMGVGGGIVMVPAMVFFLGLPQQMAQGISLAVIVPTALSGTLVHSRHGTVKFDVALWLAVGGVLAGLIGAKIALGQEQWVLKAAFGTLMVVIGALMLRQKTNPPVPAEETPTLEEQVTEELSD